jgi:CheY-like chemotaxis protein
MSTVQKRRSILVVDDEDAVREAVCQALAKEGYHIVDASSATDAIYEASRHKFDATILDIRMPGMSGDDLLPLLKKSCPHTAVIVLTAMSGDDPRFQALASSHQVFACLKKPCTIKDLRDTLRLALEQKSGHADLAVEPELGSLLDRAGRFLRPARHGPP